MAKPARQPHRNAAAAPSAIAVTATGVLSVDASTYPRPDPAGREHHAIATMAARGTACDAISVCRTRGVARYSKACHRASTLNKIRTAPNAPMRPSVRIDIRRLGERPARSDPVSAGASSCITPDKAVQNTTVANAAMEIGNVFAASKYMPAPAPPRMAPAMGK